MIRTIVKLVKRVNCKHKMMPYKYTDMKISDGVYKRVHIWKCTKCGKEEWG